MNNFKVNKGCDLTFDVISHEAVKNEINNGKDNNRPYNNKLVSNIVEGPGPEIWDKPIEFLFSCIAMSVGLGNIWRFPSVAFENGGAAFLIPYFIVLIFIGSPIYFLEMAIGQFSSSGQVKVWKMVPFFKGVGYGTFLTCAYTVSYYCSIMAITLYYLFASFSFQLPWTVCNDNWSEEIDCLENTTFVNYNGTNRSVAELYYKFEVIKEIDSIDNGIGAPDWKLSLCLFAAWLAIFGSMIKGVKSSGKVAYFTAIFPYIVLLILLIRGLTLDGASRGINLLFTPQFEKLLSAKVWYAAISQCFFSLTTSFGAIIMFSSFNSFRHNFVRDVFIISITDTLTSILASSIVFAILGNLSFTLNQDIESFKVGGPGLIFISYPLAIAQFGNFPQIFSVLFFLMMFTLGIGSASSLVGAIVRTLSDQFPKINKKIITCGVCLIGFLSGLVYVTPGGQQIIGLVDFFGGGLLIYTFAILEVIGIAWIYGISNVCRDVEFMLNKSFGHFWIYWKLCWGFIIPVIMSGILIYALAYDISYPKVPAFVQGIGWMISLFALLCFPVFGFISVFKQKSSSLKDKFLDSLKPAWNWGPKDLQLHAEWEKIK